MCQIHRESFFDGTPLRNYQKRGTISLANSFCIGMPFTTPQPSSLKYPERESFRGNQAAARQNAANKHQRIEYAEQIVVLLRQIQALKSQGNAVGLWMSAPASDGSGMERGRKPARDLRRSRAR